MENPPSPSSPIRQAVLNILRTKSVEKQRIYDNAFDAFTMLKDVLHELTSELNEELGTIDKRIKLEYRDRGQYEAEIRVAGDVLIFSMHTNIFQFDRNHIIWKIPYIQKEKMNSYCGVINIYNFLTDSLRYNRLDDLGYLIGRIFINREKHYFVEGKRQVQRSCTQFGDSQIDLDSIKRIAETAIQYALDFDLLLTPYETAKIVSVAQINNKIEDAKIQTGKRLGFQFNTDDIVNEN
ncbi:MAG: hypothetical protein ACRCZB_05690 [Bacteroidales bacterium]